VYPYGIPIGRVTSVSYNAYSRTTEAVIRPFVDFSDLRHVTVMTSFIHYTDGPETGEETS
jgi:cell shape-determining protein MreC